MTPRSGWWGVNGGASASFVYDGDGNRVLRLDGSGTRVYIGDYYERQGAAVTKYYHAAGQRIAVRAGGVVYWLHGDHLGSATLATDASGNRVGELRYTPYGGVRWAWGIFPTDRLYTGQRWEASLGLYDYQARYYDPALGRFLQPDTLVPEPGNPQALNRYAYVYNNPLRYVDLTGHFSEEELLRYGVFYGPKQMAACQADEFGCAAWYWALRAAEEGDWLEAWGSINTWLRIGGSVEYRGRFGVGEGMLVLTLESGKQYQVFFGGLRDLDNPEVYLSVQNPLLEKPGDVRLQGVESLRRYVRQAEGGAHPMTEGDYWEGTIGGYFGIGGHISGRRDRFGRIYVGLNVGLGVGRWGFGITQGNLVQDYDPDPAQLNRALGGFQMALQGGYYVGGSISAVDFGPIPVQYGFSWPGLALSFGYAWRVR